MLGYSSGWEYFEWALSGSDWISVKISSWHTICCLAFAVKMANSVSQVPVCVAEESITSWQQVIHDSAISLTKLMPPPPPSPLCKGEVSAEVRGDTPTNLTDFNGDSLTQDDDELSLWLQMESSVALGDPWGVAAVWVMMGAAADGCNRFCNDDVSDLSDPLIVVLVGNSVRDATQGGWQSRIVSL